MKKLVLSLSAFALLALPSAKAQYINPDFELWTHTSSPSYDDPNVSIGTNGWQELNFASQTLAGSSPVSVFKDSLMPYHGKYDAKIMTVALSAASISLMGKYLPNDTIGVVFTGNVNVISSKISTKIPFNSPPADYYFYYQYTPVGNDTAFCLVSYSRNDTVIAVGESIFTSAMNVWTKAQVTPLTLKPGLPDSIAIWYSSSSWHKPHVGSTFYIDDATNTGIPSIFGGNDNVSVYPNPAKNEINLKVSGTTQAEKAEVYDITGKIIGAFAMHNNFLTINTQTYSSGIYFYKLFDNTGAQLNTGKFSVVR